MKNELVNIIQIKENSLSSITKFLNIVKDFSNSRGVILWELNKEIGYLFIVAYSFDDGQFYIPIDTLPVNLSITGSAIKKSHIQYVSDIESSEGHYSKTDFWQILNIHSFVSIPIEFNNGAQGALNFYCTKKNGYSKTLIKELSILADILPNWYKSLHDRAAYSLLNSVDTTFYEYEVSKNKDRIDEIYVYLKKICEIITQTFQTFETSIFLNNRFNLPEDYTCIATTWETSESKLSYRASKNDGLTGYILETQSSVYISDLQQFNHYEGKEIIDRQYPGIIWNAKGDIMRELARHHKVDIDKKITLPPVGFMGAPIFYGERLLGVIRCCAALKSPYYFGMRELDILKLVATRIGDVWNNYMQGMLLSEEPKIWTKIIETINYLDEFAIEEIKKSTYSAEFILDKLLSVIPNLIKDAEILDIRFHDNFEDGLYFSNIYGSAWHVGSTDEINSRLNKKFSLSEGRSAGAEVFKTKKTLVLDPIDISVHPYNETFPQTKRMILAPIILGEMIGVLDVRSTKDRPFPYYAKHVVELMAGQIAIYFELFTSLNNNKLIQNQHYQSLKDFAHQFRAPLYQAKIRSQKAIKELSSKFVTDELAKEVFAISGLCSKTSRVAKNLKLFADLSTNKKIKVNLVPARSYEMIKLILESARDNSVLLDAKRGIGILPERSGFKILDEVAVEIDTNMLEQCLSVLLDNAIKYSYNNTIISISANTTNGGKKNFQLVVSNKGIPLDQIEATKCILRGWQSEKARLVKGEGEGIGLWLVDNVMKAQNGQLIVRPTNKQGITKFILSFPTK